MSNVYQPPSILGPVIGVTFVIICLAILIPIINNAQKKDDIAYWSKINRDAVVKASGVHVRVTDYKNSMRFMVICRIDNGPNAIPRYQMVEFSIDELNYDVPNTIEK